MNYDNPNKRYYDNYDNDGPPFKRQRGSFRGKPNYNNPERQNFNYGRGFYGGGQNFGRGRGSYHGGRGGNRGGRGSFGRGGRGQRGGFYSRGHFDSRGGSFRGRGGPRNASSRRPETTNVIEVTFPTLNCSYKELLTDVLENCGTVLRPRPVSSTCSIEEVKENLALLKEIVIDGNKLNITVSSSAPNPLKKTVQLPEKYASQTEEIKKFFGAESIDAVKSYKEDRYIPMHILTFASEKAAQDASGKVMTLQGFPLGLKVYYEIQTLYSDAEERRDMDYLDEKAKAILEKLDVDAEIEAKEDRGDVNASKNAGKANKIVKEKSAKIKVENEEEEADKIVKEKSAKIKEENEEEEAENEEEEAENEEEEVESEGEEAENEEEEGDEGDESEEEEENDEDE